MIKVGVKSNLHPCSPFKPNSSTKFSIHVVTSVPCWQKISMDFPLASVCAWLSIHLATHIATVQKPRQMGKPNWSRCVSKSDSSMAPKPRPHHMTVQLEDCVNCLKLMCRDEYEFEFCLTIEVSTQRKGWMVGMHLAVTLYYCLHCAIANVSL